MQTLTNAVSSGRLCHAYLFCGEKGRGKVTLARIFAAAILCKSDDKPCFRCESCKKMLAQTHPDFHMCERKTAKNTFYIDTVRNLKAECYIKPNESRYKVYLLPDIQNMTIGAANAFLKILEEPPEDTVFLLTADNRSNIPETVLSRCIPFEIPQLTYEQCLNGLKDLLPGYDENEYVQAVNAAAYNLSNAQKFLTDSEYMSVYTVCREITQNLYAGNEYNVFKLLMNNAKDRNKLNLCNQTLINIIQSDFDFNKRSKLIYENINRLLEFMRGADQIINTTASVNILLPWYCSSMFECMKN